MGRFPLGAEKVPVLRRNSRILARLVLGEGGGTPQEKDRDSRRLAFIGGEKLQISASLGVCRTESTINPC